MKQYICRDWARVRLNAAPASRPARSRCSTKPPPERSTPWDAQYGSAPSKSQLRTSANRIVSIARSGLWFCLGPNEPENTTATTAVRAFQDATGRVAKSRANLRRFVREAEFQINVENRVDILHTTPGLVPFCYTVLPRCKCWEQSIASVSHE